MARKYKPVELPLRQVPAALATEEATCPNCNDRHAGVVGRMGLRLVFRCGRCLVRFHRIAPTSGLA